MKNIALSCISLLMLLTIEDTQAQVTIGSQTVPQPFSLLEVDASIQKLGLRLPQITTAERNALSVAGNTTTAPGLMIYNITTSSIEYWDGTKWVQAGGISGWALTGNAGTTAGTNFVGTTDDTDLMFKRNSIAAGRLATDNTSFGVEALLNNTGSFNVAFGSGSLKSNTSGANNIAVGVNGLLNNINGYSNTAIGYSSLGNNSDGNYNIAVGGTSLQANISGSENTGLGYSALRLNTYGNTNIGIGYLSGGNLTTGSNNIAIGANADFASGTANNQLNIGNTIYGTGMGTATAKIGIGTNAPQKNLHVNGSLQITNELNVGGNATAEGNAGNSGQILTSSGSGAAPTWQTINTVSGTIASITYVQGTTQATIPAGTTADVPGVTATLTVPPGRTQTFLFTILCYSNDPEAPVSTQGVFSLLQNGVKISSAFSSETGPGGGAEGLTNLPNPVTFLKAVSLPAGTYTFKVQYTSWHGLAKVNVVPSIYNGYNGDTEAMLTKMQILVYNN